MSEKVDNQYKQALGDELPTTRGAAITCGMAYFQVEDALEKKAWESTTADTFSTDLADQHRLAGQDGDAANEALETKHDNEDDKVDPDHDHATWP